MRIWVIAWRTVFPAGRVRIRSVAFLGGGGHVVPDLHRELPGDPEEKDAADEQQPLDVQKPRDEEGEDDPQHGREGDAAHDHLAALMRGKAGCGERHRDRVVSGEDEIDQDDLSEGAERAEVNVEGHGSRSRECARGTGCIPGQPVQVPLQRASRDRAEEAKGAAGGGAPRGSGYGHEVVCSAVDSDVAQVRRRVVEAAAC